MTMLRHRQSLAVLGVLAAALVAGGTSFAAARAETSIPAQLGANDDTGKYAPDGGEAFYARMAADGLRQTVITVRWLPSEPLEIKERAMLERSVANATAVGLKVVFATYPYPPREIEGGIATPEAFGAWLGLLARAFPQVKQYVVGNEPNQPAFFRPQFVDGRQASAALFAPYLAAGYDALKQADPTIAVIGVGLSPRGNDRPDARSNISTSPVRFLAALGRWYRASGREAPLMDGFSFHPYPNRATDPLARGYPWPNAGFVDLARIKQALFDAFRGTPQPTPTQGLRLYLDEVGWQVDTEGLPGYSGTENVAVTDDLSQASIYGQLVREAMCDPLIAEVNIFGFFDDSNRTGFQAGLNRADGTPRPSAQAVRDALAAGCPLVQDAWRPSARVIGTTTPVIVRTATGIRVSVGAAEGATARVCAVAGAGSESVVRARLARASSPGCVRATVGVLRPTVFDVPTSSATVTVGVRLAAETAPRRRTVTVAVVD